MSVHVFPDYAPSEADICIIGAGPAGLSLALEFAETTFRVCVLESGGYDLDPGVETLSEIESVGLRRAPQDVTRRRGLGGTSAIWSGRCGVFDAIDYAARPWVPHSGWPITPLDVAPYLERAGSLLGLGPAYYAEADYPRFQHDRRAPDWNSDVFRPVIFQFSKNSQGSADPARTFAAEGIEGAENIGALQHAGAPKPMHFGEAYRDRINASDTIRLVLGANVTSIEADPADARVRGVTIRSLSGQTAQVRAPIVILACGGIDNARLLLCSKGAGGKALGDSGGALGRFLSDHPFAAIARYSGRGSRLIRRRLGHRWLDHRGSRHVYSLGVRLAPEVQRREKLLNCAVHIVERGERVSPLSRGRNALALSKKRAIGREFADELRGALSDPVDLARGAYSRYVDHQPHLESPEYVEFGCVVEQVPDPLSRVTLSNEIDALGMPRARIDWRASDHEFHTAARMAELLKAEMLPLGVDLPEFASWLGGGPDDFRSLIHDMAHPMGATRMSADPSEGVVDSNCEVHGVSGLFVAGGSVFPTSGYMNPTLMIVALSLRLADHVKRATARTPARAIEAPKNSDRTPASVAAPRAKVGLVGVGDRMSSIYWPILAALDQEVEVVGATSRSPGSLSQFAQARGIDSFEDAASMIRDARPDFLVVAVSPGSVDQALLSLLALGTPMLVETPIAWSVRRGRNVVKTIKRGGMIVGVAEQTPFLPDEQLKRRLIDLGLVGSVNAAHNDFAVYDYHGVAVARSYLAGRRAIRVNASTHRPPSALESDANASRQMDLYATVDHDDGSTLIHHYGDASATTRFREPRGLRVFGSAGAIIDDALITEGSDGEALTRRFERAVVDGRLQAVSVDTPLGRIVWTNPFAAHAFNDEQIAVATLLRDMADAVRDRRSPIYGAENALADVELLAAMRLSAQRRGMAVRLPLDLRKHAIYTAIIPKLAARVSRAKASLVRRMGGYRPGASIQNLCSPLGVLRHPSWRRGCAFPTRAWLKSPVLTSGGLDLPVAAPCAPWNAVRHQPIAVGSHVAMPGKQNTSTSATSCRPMKGTTPL